MNKRVFTVGQVNGYIRTMFARDGFLSAVAVSGEVSNCKYHSSGHIYFSLKDEKSAIACVMFAGNRRGLAFRMKDGDKVIVSGNVDVFERDGRYQLYAQKIVLTGSGLLYERYLALKKELEEEGLFDPLYKKPIPRYAARVGIVTAPTGAAIRDIQNISARRNPYVQLILYPALVQGDGAKESIAAGIRALDDLGVDVMIVGRGGGSIEDLWAFNEEAVARAIFACQTPVISAVGHETDTTIADFAADLRAPTPSAAAELAVFDLAAFEQQTARYAQLLARGTRERARSAASAARWYEARLAALSPAAKLRDEKHRRDEYLERLPGAMQRRIERAAERQAQLSDRMARAAYETLDRRRTKQQLLIERMKGINPLDRLKQGYSYTEDSGRRAVRSVGQVKAGDALKIYVTDGTILTEVRAVEAGDHGIREKE